MLSKLAFFYGLTLGGPAVLLVLGLARPQAVLRTQSDLVVVPVNVLEKKTGTPILGLEKTDFRLRIDGKLTAIAAFERGSTARAPYAIALVVDYWSLEGGDWRRAFATDNWRDWFGEMGAEDQFALVLAGEHQAQLLQDFTRRRELIAAAFQRLASLRFPKHPQPTKKRKEKSIQFDPQLVTAIGFAAAQVRTLEPRYVKQIVVITEDVNLVRRADSDQALRELEEQNIRVNVVRVKDLLAAMARSIQHKNAQLETRKERKRGEAFEDAVAARYAAETGGILVKSSSKDVASTVQRLFSALDDGYVLFFRPPVDLTSGQTHSISVGVRSSDPPPGKLRIVYRRSFRAWALPKE
ncbi:MAG TPA: VWA domain-containing protein [Terriglobia bacterium]|nr:VWA domain-containing protein [Terriglobia bacterium]